ncbi:MAG: DUF6285 domain-containing protein [Kiloniellaceae bacterium]
MSGTPPTRGGEPGGARLLALARRELLEVLLPQLDGDARYRARLIANAMKIAAEELEAGAPLDGEAERLLRGFTGKAAGSAAALQVEIAAALRGGKLDGNSDLFDLLTRLTSARRSLIG